jgi:DNA replication and repair protein RecF
LDENRISKLLQYIDSENCGQVFMTDARPERTQKLVENLHRKVNITKI